MLIVGILAYSYFAHIIPTPSNTPQSTTTASKVSAAYLSSCQSITSPGTYYLSENVKTSNTAAPCIAVASPDVSIMCGTNTIQGSGPYTGIPPFSYGIFVANQSNFSVQGCTISNFSYGVYAYRVQDLSILNSNISTNYISNINLDNSTGNVADNLLSSSASPYGAVYVTGQNSSIVFRNNTLIQDYVIGFNVSASNNQFIDNYVAGSQLSFVCGPGSGYKFSSYAQGNICYNQSGCSFLTCVGANIPANISQTVLGPSINSCGTIRSPGTYALSSDISPSTYLGISQQLQEQYNIPCISIMAPSVTLSCTGYTISSAFEGILVHAPNVTVRNCTVDSSIIGIAVKDSAQNKLVSQSGNNDTYAIFLNGSAGTILQNASSTNSSYGLYLTNTSSSQVYNMHMLYNLYGVYLTQSESNIFSSGISRNNTNYDVYATPDSAGQNTNLMLLTSCGLTNTAWATCARRTANATTNSIQVFSCIRIVKPGSYFLSQSIVTDQDDCIDVETSDVVLNCGSRTVASSGGTGAGPAFLLQNVTNVTLNNCRASGFQYAINVSNAYDINIMNSTGYGAVEYGITLRNVMLSTVQNAMFTTASNVSIAMYNSSHNIITRNNVSGGGPNTGILVSSASKNNEITYNRGIANHVGIMIEQKSFNNTVQYNNFTGSAQADYACDAQDSALGSEYGIINYGGKKDGCNWMVVVLPGAAPIQCPVATGASTYVIQTDGFYSTGAICYSIYANTTTINCEGHTIAALNGGTFANFVRSQGSTLENCYLEGFTQPVMSELGGVTLYNDTIYQNASTAAFPAVTMSGGSDAMLNSLSIATAGEGISLTGMKTGTLEYNNVSSSGTAYYVTNSVGLQFDNNIASASSGVGIFLSNSTQNLFQGNRFGGLTYGMLCSTKSSGAVNNTDEGQNYCSKETGCGWITQSSASCSS